MDHVLPTVRSKVIAAVVLVAFAGLLGAGLAGWLRHGTALFVSLAEAGLALCM